MERPPCNSSQQALPPPFRRSGLEPTVDEIERNIELGAIHGDAYAAATAQTLRLEMVEDVRIASLLGAAAPVRGAETAAGSFRVPQLATVSATGEAIGRMATRVAAGNDALAAAVRGRLDLADHLAQLDRELLADAGRPQGQRDASTEASLRSDFESTAARLGTAIRNYGDALRVRNLLE